MKITKEEVRKLLMDFLEMTNIDNNCAIRENIEESNMIIDFYLNAPDNAAKFEDDMAIDDNTSNNKSSNFGRPFDEPLNDDATINHVNVHSRGIGLESNVPCFICGKEGLNGYNHNISMFVDSKEEGQQVVMMFNNEYGRGARLDYRANEPDWIQVKVGACDEHMNRLNLLDNLITTDNNISTAKIGLAKIDVTICPYCGRKLDCEIEIDADGEIISCGCSHCNDEFFDK